eukprot:367861-Rhodomonas_salina.4
MFHQLSSPASAPTGSSQVPDFLGSLWPMYQDRPHLQGKKRSSRNTFHLRIVPPQGKRCKEWMNSTSSAYAHCVGEIRAREALCRSDRRSAVRVDLARAARARARASFVPSSGAWRAHETVFERALLSHTAFLAFLQFQREVVEPVTEGARSQHVIASLFLPCGVGNHGNNVAVAEALQAWGTGLACFCVWSHDVFGFFLTCLALLSVMVEDARGVARA